LLADDPENLANAVLRLLDHPEEGRDLAAHGRSVVKRLYSWEGAGGAFQTLLRDLAENEKTRL